MTDPLPDPRDALPVIPGPRASFRPQPLWRRMLLRVFRAALVVTAFWLIHSSHQRFLASQPPAQFTFDDVARLFPTAARLGPRDPRDDRWTVLDASGQTLGTVLATSPETDRIVGYSGPSNLLVGLNPDGEILGASLLWSRDTAEHIEQVQGSNRFWSQLKGWNPGLGERRTVEGVSGSTLTSLAMVESIESRLSGHPSSLRFPIPIGLDDAQALFPKAESTVLVSSDPEVHDVRDAAGNVLGFVLRTSPFAESVRGYGGPTEALVGLEASRQRVTVVKLRSSYDTPEYVERVRNDDDFLKSLAGRTVDDSARLDFQKAGIEGVSGATQTSFALAEGVRRRLAEEAAAQSRAAAPPSPHWKRRDLGMLLVIAGGLLMTFAFGWAGRRVRFLWQLVLVLAFGLWLGDMLSIALVAGWSRSGVAWVASPGLVALTAVALVIPWTTRRQVYCHSLCPHGAVQEWLGRFRKLHLRLPARVNRILGAIPWLLLVFAFVAALRWPAFNLAALEPFDAWVLGTAAVASLVVAITGLIAALFVPQAYCRFGCPTGALLKFVRSHGQADRLRPHDALAALLLAVSAVCVLRPEAAAGDSSARSGPVELTGRAFGTTWSVKVRGHLASPRLLQDELAAELERIESRLSHWRPDSETSQFNASETTLEIECSHELAMLIGRAKRLSQATDGEYDITIGPLVDAWGGGPSGPKSSPPDDATIDRLRAATGWSKIDMEESIPSLRKTDPAVKVDLGSLLQGFAVDQLHDLLKARGLNEFLVEIGGELRASGRWQVALDSEAGAWATPAFELENAAVSTSGSYRSASNIISPKTGRPAKANWRAVAVLADSCLEADAWDTALLVAPNAEQIAAQEHLAAQLIPAGGEPSVQTPQWKERAP